MKVAILLPDVDDEIQAVGKIVPGRFEIARVPVGFGLRGAARNLDVGSPGRGQGRHIECEIGEVQSDWRGTDDRKNLSTLDIADKIHDSSTVRQEVPLAAGDYEINIYPLSEIIANLNDQ
jgi:hypothetical protein